MLYVRTLTICRLLVYFVSAAGCQCFVLQCVESVLRHHFKLAYVIPQMAVKEFLKPTSKNGDIGHFNLWSHFDQP